MTNVTRTEERVITLKEIVDTINVERVANGERKLEHGKQMSKVAELAKESSFGRVAITSTRISTGNGTVKEIETYNLTKKQAIAVGAKLDNKRLILIVDKLEELSQPKQLSEKEVMYQMLGDQIALERQFKEQQQVLEQVVSKVEALPEAIQDELDERFDKQPPEGYVKVSELQSRYGTSRTVILRPIEAYHLHLHSVKCHKLIEGVGIKNYDSYNLKEADIAFKKLMKSSTGVTPKFFESIVIHGRFKVANRSYVPKKAEFCKR